MPMRPSASRRRIVRSERTTARFWRNALGSGRLSVLTPVDPDRRRRRRRVSKRRYRARRIVALAAFACVAAAIAYTALALTGGGQTEPVSAAQPASKQAKTPAAAPEQRAVPREMRGVHVTMALAGLPGKLASYTALKHAGLNTIELDVKDENGDVAFVRGAPHLARATGAAKP